jgi:hypothetical protein
VSSPNEPGNGNSPRPAGTRPAGTNPGAAPERTEAPSWQRSATTRTQRRSDASTPQSKGIEDRINRFISGGSASSSSPGAANAEPAPSQTRTEAITSELPDLSDPPRPSRSKPAEQKTEAPPSAPRRARVQVGSRTGGPLRASMQIRRVDPWSVLKVSLILSVAMFFVWMIAVAFLYLVLGGMGVWSKLNSNVGDLLTNTPNSELVSSSAIFGGAALIGLVNIVLLTAMATVGAFIYNLTTDLVGGVEVTLADRD